MPGHAGASRWRRERPRQGPSDPGQLIPPCPARRGLWAAGSTWPLPTRCQQPLPTQTCPAPVFPAPPLPLRGQRPGHHEPHRPGLRPLLPPASCREALCLQDGAWDKGVLEHLGHHRPGDSLGLWPRRGMTWRQIRASGAPAPLPGLRDSGPSPVGRWRRGGWRSLQWEPASGCHRMVGTGPACTSGTGCPPGLWPSCLGALGTHGPRSAEVLSL